MPAVDCGAPAAVAGSSSAHLTAPGQKIQLSYVFRTSIVLKPKVLSTFGVFAYSTQSDFKISLLLRHTVEGAAVGQEFLLFFTGAVGPIPFERVHLPAFVLPRLHASLSGLLSANPLVGQRIRKSAKPPVAHPGRFSDD